MIRTFIQARMSSSRFPGKVLVPFRGRPIIAHVIAAAARVFPPDRITVATSTETSDDPLACYVREMGISVHRGSLDNVVERFQSCLQTFPCDWFFRICADSPLLDPILFHSLLRYSDRQDVDLVTNVFPRTFPKGESLEMLNAATFAAIDSHRLNPNAREHVTQVYYLHPELFRIVNIEATEPRLFGTSLVVDTLEDWRRLETGRNLTGAALSQKVGKAP